MVRWMPGLPRRGAKVRSMIAFGGNVAVSYLILNVNRGADNVLIGWHWGAGPLGLYSRAYNLLMLPVRQLSGPAASVAVPAFSRIQSDPERFSRYYLRVVNLIYVDQCSSLRVSFRCCEAGDCLDTWKSVARSCTCFPDSCNLCIWSTAPRLDYLAVCESRAIAAASQAPGNHVAHNDPQLRDRPTFRNQGRRAIRVLDPTRDVALDTQVQLSRHRADLEAAWTGYPASNFVMLGWRLLGGTWALLGRPSANSYAAPSCGCRFCDRLFIVLADTSSSVRGHVS